MTLNEAKTELKRKGYSIVTIYTPKQDKIVINILKHNKVLFGGVGYPEECTEYLINANEILK